jgi:hypothetical protein
VKTTAYFDRRKSEHDVTLTEVAHALAHEAAREVQSDGRIRVWGYSPRHAKYLRVVLLSDGETVHNAFPDRGFNP